jgi:hypothetical protein
VLLFLFTAMRGRRFGRAVPSFDRSPPRTRTEYVSTLAGMLRRGRHAEWARQRYLAQVRRSLTAPYGISPDLPLEELLQAVIARRPQAAGLEPLLGELEQPRLPEARLVELMRGIDARLSARTS